LLRLSDRLHNFIFVGDGEIAESTERLKLDRATLRKHEEKILRGLVAFYYEERGFEVAEYKDKKTGGIYEHELAAKLGYQPIGMSPPEFIEACESLEDQGLVRRMKRHPNIIEMGVWPTRLGLDRAEYLSASFLKKIRMSISNNWQVVVLQIVITICTLSVAAVFGVFGLKY
jgi:hypothetical protein